MEKYIKGEFTPGTLRLPVCRRQLVNDLAEELTLPDYQPAVNRLLRITPVVTPPARYIGAGRLELSGSVTYGILYAGEDGQLYTAALPAAYSFEAAPDELPEADLTSGACLLAVVHPESVTGRVTAPRRLSLRTRMVADVTCLADCHPEEILEGDVAPSSLRRLTGEAEFCDAVHAEEESIPLEDEIIPEQGDGELRIIGADGWVFVSEASAARGCIVCRGDLVTRILLCREGGQSGVESIVRRLPFVRELAAPQVSPGWECRGFGRCQSVNVSVGEGRLLCEAVMSLEAEAYNKNSFIFTRDIYSTDSPAETVMTKRQLTLPLKASNGNFSQSGVFDVAEAKLPAGARIVDAVGSAIADSIVCERGRCIVTGEVHYNLVYTDGEQYGAVELAQPLRYETDLAGGVPDGPLDGGAELTVMSCRPRMDGERVSVDCEIGVALAVGLPQQVSMLERARFTGGESTHAGECIVCYPDSGDTLWSVARRYLADADAIAAANSLDPRAPDAPASLAGAKFLIV